MVRSPMPLASLLGLFGALLILSPEVLMRSSEIFSDFAAIDPQTQKAFAFGVENFNQDKGDSHNYFKMSRFTKRRAGNNFGFVVEFVETTCEKEPGSKMVYNNIQKCQGLPGNPKKLICYLEVFHDELLSLLRMNAYFCY